MQSKSKYLILSLVLIVITVWIFVFESPDNKFHLIACDVGQGDAILATYKDIQILVDGGPNNKVLDCLSKYVPFWDRKIEIVMLSHPQTDHYTGLIEVFKRYKVEYFLANALNSDAPAYEALKEEVKLKKIRVVNPMFGFGIRVGDIRLDIVWPTLEFLSAEGADINSQGKLGTFSSKKDPNDFSIQAILSFGNFDAYLTGDIGPEEIPSVLATGIIKKAEYLKVPHHGSKNGLTKEYLDAINPKIAVISAGRNNIYGHPHKETLEMLKEDLPAGRQVLRTDEEGNIEIVSDGKSYKIKS